VSRRSDSMNSAPPHRGTFRPINNDGISLS
jgi:hypothetical protein